MIILSHWEWELYRDYKRRERITMQINMYEELFKQVDENRYD